MYPSSPLPCAQAHGSTCRSSAGSRTRTARTSHFVFLLALLAVFATALLPSAAEAAKKKKKDTKAPYVISGLTQDTDGNGRIDAILLTYSEKVKIAKVKKGKKPKKSKKKKAPVAWSVKGRTFKTVRAMSGGKTILVSVSEATASDSAERPTISYLRVPRGIKGVVDKAGNQALTAAIKAKDGVAPKLSSARTVDKNSNGQVDTIELTYSEEMSSTDATQIAVSGHAVTAGSASGSTVSLTVDERGVDTASTPTVTVPSGAVKDGGGNPTTGPDSVTAADGAAPAIVGATTGDTDVDGRLDTMTLTFSETIVHPAEIGTGSVAVSGFSTTAVSAASGSSLTVTFSETGGFNTHVKPAVSSSTSGTPVTDTFGNAMGSSSFTGTADGAGPALVTARTRDNDTDGLLDAIVATFSEPITYSSVATNFSTSGPAAAALGTLTSTVTVNGASATIAVTEVSAPNFNTDLPRVGLQVPITYTPPGSGGATDAAGIAAATATVNAIDGAGPAITYADTLDTSAQPDGIIDEMRIGFSEPITTLTGAPFTIASGLRAVTATAKITGALTSDPWYGGVRVTLTPRSTPDGADKPTVDYTGSTANRAYDANGNEVPGTSLQAFTDTTDKVSPVMISAETLDASPANGYVDTVRTTWSEPVATDGAPNLTVSGTSAPPGYVPPVPTTGATASNYVVDVPLTPSSTPDRDVLMRVRYTGTPNTDGITDQADTPNDAAASGATGLDALAVCSDENEADTGSQNDTSGTANATALSAVATPYQTTLCGVDQDHFSFSAVNGETHKVHFSPSSEAFSLTGRNASYDPFTLSGPGSPSMTVSFTAGAGWTGTFTAAGTGTYTVGVRDTNSPVADYGYCITRTADGSNPTCSLRQGDLVITEVLKDVPSGVTTIGPYVEMKNTSGQTIDYADIAGLTLNVGAASCTVTLRGDTPATLVAGGSFYISSVARGSVTNDLNCPGMPSIDYGQPISVATTNGPIDSVNFNSATVPRWFSVQLRAASQYETSVANDNVPNAWCTSADTLGTAGTANSNCDEFHINEVKFFPSSSDRDGDVYVEVKGNGALTPASSLLGNWRIRVKRHSDMTGRFYALPATANPTGEGIFVLADSPATGNTEVPFYSVQSSDVLTGPGTDGRDLDSYLRADTPVTVKLMEPNLGTPYSCDNAAHDTLGYIPTPSGTMSGAVTDGICGVHFLVQAFKPTNGYQSNETIQRTLNGPWSNDNSLDFCTRAPYTPLQDNSDCLTLF